MVEYASKVRVGLSRVASLGDGYTINLQWFQAYPNVQSNKIAYHIYYGSRSQDVIHGAEEPDIFEEGVKLVVIDGSLEANVISLIPGQLYWFCVRPVEYDPTIFDLANLPVAYDNIRFYPSSILSQNMTATELIVPLMDVTGFPNTGIVKVGYELILYTAVDVANNELLVPGGIDPISGHLLLQPDGYYYTASASNIGQGTINSLTLVGGDVNETWNIRCIFIQRDSGGNPIAGTAKFEAIGSITGPPVDGYGNFFVWSVNGPVVSNGYLSFSITETVPFVPGDNFVTQVVGAVPGVNGGRGFANTPITPHYINGFDGYYRHNPQVQVFTLTESRIFDNIYACLSRFEYPNFAFTILDGYKQVPIDYLSTDDSAADAANVTFPPYDYCGYHRTDPVLLLNGTCVGSYIGGQMGGIDANGNYSLYRGMSLQQQNTQREALELSVTGQPAVLIKRQQSGIVCSCYLSTSEYPDDRCPFCYGTKFVFGYEQYFNPLESDGRILVRLGPTAENLRMQEAGLESTFPLDMWTLTVPTVKTRDVIVLFDQDDNESFRYEVGDVIRNNTILGLDGGQHLKTFRIRKTDPAYQIRIFRNTSEFPETFNTSLGFTAGIPVHSHMVTRNEKDPSTWSQTTQISQGHNHPVLIKNGLPVVMEVLSHTHQIIIP
jgi:hypothetical protein